MKGYLLAMSFGVLGSIQLHLAKCLQLQGISAAGDLIRLTRGKKERRASTQVRNIYLLGLFMSNSGFFWILLANKYGPTSFFTSMFGTGLIFLMFYSQRILKEKVSTKTYISAFILTAGTLILGISSLRANDVGMSAIDSNLVITLALSFIAFSLVLFLVYRKSRNPLIISTVFGLISGGLASFDPLFKGIGQNYAETAGLLPSHPRGWLIFIGSLIFSTSAFGFTQLGFYKQARATSFVPVFNSVYIVFPVLIQYFTLPGFRISWPMIMGLILIVVGLIGMKDVSKYV